MPRNGSGVYSKPAGTTAVANTVIESAKYNSTIDDLVADANTPRPIVAGGTGATSAAAARTALAVPGLAGSNTFTGIQKWAKGADVASAASLALGDDGNYFDITGTTAITSIATKGVGTRVLLRFAGSLTLTHNATSLILPGGANITTAAGDHAELVEYSAGNWRCFDYSRASDASVDIASATTTDIGAAASQNVRITGTTTITGLGTVAAGTFRRVVFAGALTLTHNATSLILPGAANITTAAGDVAEFVSAGSGNWRCVDYVLASYPPATITPWVSYTPTLTGFGTTTINVCRSRRVGSNLEVHLDFTVGTPTAVTAAITLGFNGTNGGITIASGYSSTFIFGTWGSSETGATIVIPSIIGVSAAGSVNFGAKLSGRSVLTAVNGSTVFGAGERITVNFSVPIQGWN